MQKKILTSIAVAMAFAFVAMPANVGADAERVTVDSIGDTSIGTDHRTTCESTALLVLDLPPCEETEHEDGWTGNLIHGFNSPNGDVTGATTSVVSHAGGERTWTCNWEAGQFVSCSGGGVWPGIGVPFTHTCYSEAGALGNWGCYIEHF